MFFQWYPFSRTKHMCPPRDIAPTLFLTGKVDDIIKLLAFFCALERNLYVAMFITLVAHCVILQDVVK